MSRPSATLVRHVVLSCFVLSGVSGLVYEVVWTRKLTLVFGSTTLAVSLSLAAYLAGLALGADFFGRRADRLRRPARAYGWMELGIGVYGLASGWLLDLVGPVYLTLVRDLALPAPFIAPLQAALVALVLLVPTALMGGTLPVLTRLATADRLGAAAGAALAGFVLLPVLGLQRSLAVAAALNLLCSAVVLLVARSRAAEDAAVQLKPDATSTGAVRLKPDTTRAGTAGAEVIASGFGLRMKLRRTAVALAEAVRRTSPAPDPTGAAVRDAGVVAAGFSRTRPAPAHLPGPLVALVVTVSGFCALFYEVVWTRALELVLGSSTQAFSLMLTTFLLGLALGAALSGALVRRGYRSPALFALLQLLVGVASFVTLTLIPRLPHWFVTLYAHTATAPLGFVIGQAALCASVLLAPTLALGLVFPLAVELARRPTDLPQASRPASPPRDARLKPCATNFAGVAQAFRPAIRRRPERPGDAHLVGRLYALNTAGCIAGALAAGLLLIPALGMRRALLLGLWLNLTLAALLFTATTRTFSRRLAAATAPFFLAAFFTVEAPAWDPLAMTSGVYFYAPKIVEIGIERYRQSQASLDLVFHREGPTATVTVTRTASSSLAHLAINGRGEGTARSTAPLLLAHLPLILGRSAAGADDEALAVPLPPAMEDERR